MGLFDIFDAEPITLIVLNSNAEGNSEGTRYTTTGIFKLRDGMSQLESIQQRTSDATLYIRPNEPFIAAVGDELVGQLVRIARDSATEKLYRVQTMVEGYDYDLNRLDFYRLDLKREETTQWASSSPLT